MLELLGVDNQSAKDIDPHLLVAFEFLSGSNSRSTKPCISPFLEDRRRCGGLFASKSDICQFIVKLCLNMVAQEKTATMTLDLVPHNAHLYAKKHWFDHLVKINSLEEPILSLFRQASKGYKPTVQSFFDTTLHWVRHKFNFTALLSYH